MIITNDEAALRVHCDAVLSDEVGELIETLEKELDYANKLGKNGIGLAAPQIGIAKDIAIIRLPQLKLDLVNAKIEKSHDQIVFKDEGCLSFPGRVETTERYQEVVISNMTTPEHYIATGFAAIAIQHEIDHLNSVLFFDHKIAKLQQVIRSNKIGLNEPCPCGIKDPATNKVKKFKKCCGK
jgi:peptide deformylase